MVEDKIMKHLQASATKMGFIALAFILCAVGATYTQSNDSSYNLERLDRIFSQDTARYATEFDFPAGFEVERKLGSAVQVIANGLVISVESNDQTYGRVVRVVHKMKTRKGFEWVESIYAHLGTTEVKAGDFVKRGDRIGTLGSDLNNNFGYLHLEMRSEIGLPLTRRVSVKNPMGDDWSS
jgi:hypothetical protein